jgi:hypothetical protein
MDRVVCCTDWNVTWCLFSVSRQIPGNMRSASSCKYMQDDYISIYWTFYDRAGEIIQANQSPFGSQFYSFLNGFWFFFRYNIWAFLLSRWPCSVRCRSAATRLLGLRVRIPSGAWISLVSVMCVQKGSSIGRSLVRRNPTECGVSGCGLKT